MSRVPLLSSVRRVLAIGAHPDDIEIGCGGTLRTLAKVNPTAEVRWLVLTAEGVRHDEAIDSAKRYLPDPERLTLHDFRDGYLPYADPAGVKEALAAHSARFAPDVVLAPRRDDAHQDHAFLGRLVGQVHRRQLVLHYEIAKVDGDLGPVNLYVPLAADDVTAKIADLFVTFPSQTHRGWFDDEAFRSLLRLRGLEAGSESGYAEAFLTEKLVVS